MSTAWQGHGTRNVSWPRRCTGMLNAWSKPLKFLTKAWETHGNNRANGDMSTAMATASQRPGEGRAKAWHGHGIALGKTWHGNRIGTAPSYMHGKCYANGVQDPGIGKRARQHYGQRVAKNIGTHIANTCQGTGMATSCHGHNTATTSHRHVHRDGNGDAKAEHGKGMAKTWQQRGNGGIANPCHRQVRSMATAGPKHGKGILITTRPKHCKCLCKTWQTV